MSSFARALEAWALRGDRVLALAGRTARALPTPRPQRARGRRDGRLPPVLACAALALSAPLAQRAQAVGPARLTVEVYRDLEPGEAPAPRAAAERVELLVDLTRSTLRATNDGLTLADLAKSGAAGFLASLDARTEVAVTVFGHAAGERCTEAERILGAGSPSRPGTAERLQGLTPRSEASLAGAVDHVRLDLEREPGARRVRVVVVTDLDDATSDPCGGDLCDAARSLVAAGAWLEIAPLRDVAPPACLSALLPSPARPAPASAADDAPSFSVATSAGADVVAEGRAGAGAVEVPAGLLTLLVHLDPPEQIGPFRLGPGESARVSVLEGLESGVPTRIWRIERGDEAVGRAFPPPDVLPREP